VPDVDAIIVTVRGQKVILDSDLARLYGVPVKRLNEQLSRNLRKFPADFAFQLSAAEWAALRSQIVTAPTQASANHGVPSNWSQFATSSRLRRGAAYRPWAFTEHGAMMAANILNSDRAVEMSVYVIRAFVKMRAELATHQDLARRLAEIEKTLIGHDAALRDLYNKIRPLLLPLPEPRRREIGFHAIGGDEADEGKTKPVGRKKAQKTQTILAAD
jgi:hypothetical protein